MGWDLQRVWEKPLVVPISSLFQDAVHCWPYGCVLSLIPFVKLPPVYLPRKLNHCLWSSLWKPAHVQWLRVSECMGGYNQVLITWHRHKDLYMRSLYLDFTAPSSINMISYIPKSLTESGASLASFLAPPPLLQSAPSLLGPTLFLCHHYNFFAFNISELVNLLLVLAPFLASSPNRETLSTRKLFPSINV